ncbi:hypothetical protein JAAARDRAFT_211502 [Jaapia argillacea MUCL 33604]|uniref:MYND-type domain-containing protein n=1 Tax=Jaapia argillacea MUCL 33604 TaxID=933084 RepID=A0A067PIG4_9AGAM|nr:hypothetical protein JAAARDRAFT_211502 [Jaapia argillacea MUCL 33604]
MDKITVIPLVRLLLQNGANPNHQDRYGSVPIHGAFQANQVEGVELLMEHGADLEIPDADGFRPSQAYLGAGPQVTSTVRKWMRKRAGEEAPMDEKKCDNCRASAGENVKLRMCGSCHTTRYCSVECQKKHWPSHKPICRPFSESNTVTLKPTYEQHGVLMPTAHMTRQFFGQDVGPVPEHQQRAANVPRGSTSKTKSMVIKVQVPYTPGDIPTASQAPLLIYTKKRDFVCSIKRGDGPKAYDTLAAIVKSKGVGGAKGYFPAELKGKDELVVKVDQILAEQPF